MIEFARRNAGVAAAVGAYGAIAAGTILAAQHLASPGGRPVAEAPTPGPSGASQPASPSASPPPNSVASSSPAPVRGAEQRGRPVAVPGAASSAGQQHPAALAPHPSHPAKPPATAAPVQPASCRSGHLLAVRLPLGVLPCAAVRVGDDITIGGER